MAVQDPTSPLCPLQRRHFSPSANSTQGRYSIHTRYNSLTESFFSRLWCRFMPPPPLFGTQLSLCHGTRQLNQRAKALWHAADRPVSRGAVRRCCCTLRSGSLTISIILTQNCLSINCWSQYVEHFSTALPAPRRARPADKCARSWADAMSLKACTLSRQHRGARRAPTVCACGGARVVRLLLRV